MYCRNGAPEVPEGFPAEVVLPGQEKFIKDEKTNILKLLCIVLLFVSGGRQGILYKEVLKPQVECLVAGPACIHPQRICQKCLTASRGATEDDVTALFNIGIGGKQMNEATVKVAVRKVLDVGKVCLAVGEMGIPNEPFQFVVQPYVGFMVNNEGEPFIKGHVGEVFRMFQLCHISTCHGRKPHFLKFTDGSIPHDDHLRNKPRP